MHGGSVNEQLKELARQAESAANEIFDFQGKGYYGIVMEKFAELIIKECASIVYKTDSVDADGMALLLLQSFGVEE